MKTLDLIIKKYGLHIGREFFIEIPDMNREDLAKLFAELGFTKGAEIGVELGYYSEVLCQSNPKLHLSCIDPWSAGAYEPGIDGVDEEQRQYDERYKETVKRLSPYNCTIIRKGSMEALNDFEDGSLDFVYIDANHDFPNFTNDLHNWKKKVRIGGIVAGHDYAYFSFKKRNHVKRVLETYTRCYRMRPYFVVGAMEYNGLKRDQYRSWFWIREEVSNE